MGDLLLEKQARDTLFTQLETAQRELTESKRDSEYYRQELHKTRLRILEIKNMVGAKSIVADSETVDAAWMRNIDEILEKLSGITL